MPKLRHLDLRPVTPEERVFGAQTRLKEYMEGVVLCCVELCFYLYRFLYSLMNLIVTVCISICFYLLDFNFISIFGEHSRHDCVLHVCFFQ